MTTTEPGATTRIAMTRCTGRVTGLSCAACGEKGHQVIYRIDNVPDNVPAVIVLCLPCLQAISDAAIIALTAAKEPT
jgi:hypothetical protein